MASARQSVILAMLLCVASAASARAEVTVVATIKPIHSLAAAVMAGAGTPRLLIDGAGSPHTFALKPSEARALQQARIVFRVSEGLEVFLNKVAKSLPRGTRVVDLDEAPGVTLLPLRAGGAFDEHKHESAKGGKHKHKGGHDHGHDHSGNDGHLWLDPDNAKAIARYMADALAAADPGNASLYRSNADRLTSRIDALALDLAGELKPVAGKTYVVFHDAYQYFERRFGLAAIGSVTVSPDSAPSAKRLTTLRRKITDLKAQCIFAEPQFEPKLLATVAEGTGARTGTLDPLGAAIPAGPDLYDALMRALAASLKSCLMQPG